MYRVGPRADENCESLGCHVVLCLQNTAVTSWLKIACSGYKGEGGFDMSKVIPAGVFINQLLVDR